MVGEPAADLSADGARLHHTGVGRHPGLPTAVPQRCGTRHGTSGDLRRRAGLNSITAMADLRCDQQTLADRLFVLRADASYRLARQEGFPTEKFESWLAEPPGTHHRCGLPRHEAQEQQT